MITGTLWILSFPLNFASKISQEPLELGLGRAFKGISARRSAELLERFRRRTLRTVLDVTPGEPVSNRIRIRRSFPKQRHPIATKATQCFLTSDENISLRMHSIAPLAISGLHKAVKRKFKIMGLGV